MEKEFDLEKNKLSIDKIRSTAEDDSSKGLEGPARKKSVKKRRRPANKEKSKSNGKSHKRGSKGQGRGRKKGRRKKRRSRKPIGGLGWILVAFGIVAAIVLIALAASLILYNRGKSNLMEANETSTIKGDETEEELKSQLQVNWQPNWVALNNQIYEYDTDTINLLFLGVDTRGKMKKENDLSKGADPGQTDAVFVLSLNEKEGKVKIVGIPRNGLMELDKYDENGQIAETVEDQICLQYPWAGGGLFGMEKTKEKVSELLYGIPIHGSVALSYDSVPIVNDMVGGVDVEVIENLTYYNKKFVPGTKIHLMGDDATTYIQRRDISVAGSPTGRLKRQKQYILELFKQTKDQIKANPTMISKIYNALDGYMLNDIGLGEAMYLATKVIKCGFDSNDMYLIDGKDKLVDNIHIKESERNKVENQFNDYILDKESIDQVMTQVFLTPVDTDIFINE